MNNDQYHWDQSYGPPQGHLPDRKGEFHGCRLASWWWRVLAGLIDWVLVVAVQWWLLLQFWSLILPTTWAQSVANLQALATAFVNSGFLAAKTTQSLGKRVCGIRMVQIRLDRTGEAHVVYVPVWVALVRLPLSYVVDWLPLGIGFWLIPNINRSRQTVADYITRCVNYRDKALPNPVHMPGAQRDWP